MNSGSLHLNTIERFGLAITSVICMQGCFIIKNALNSEISANLIQMHNAQKSFNSINNRYTNNLNEITVDLKLDDPNYQYGFNPKCFPEANAESLSNKPNFGFKKKNLFTTWLQKQPCRPDGYTFYAVHQVNTVEFEIHEINEKKQTKDYKIP